MAKVNFPDDTQRLSIVGATGTGKTQAALFHLSRRSYHLMPWVVYNGKGDDSIDNIPYSVHLELYQVPVSPGIFVIHPLPHQQEELEAHMWAVWDKGDTGVYIDEGYAVGQNNGAFRALLTQGRSRRIPMIVLSQRPVWLDRFVFSESEYFQAFRLQHARDRQAMEEIIPRRIDRLPPYYSWYYDSLENRVTQFSPVPRIEMIHDTFARRSVEAARRRRMVV